MESLICAIVAALRSIISKAALLRSSASATLVASTQALARANEVREAHRLFIYLLPSVLVTCLAAWWVHLEFRQALFGEPFCYHVGDLAVVAVHHHHVRIALDADLRQLDHIRLAASGSDRVEIGEDVLAVGDPTR